MESKRTVKGTVIVVLMEVEKNLFVRRKIEGKEYGRNHIKYKWKQIKFEDVQGFRGVPGVGGVGGAIELNDDERQDSREATDPLKFSEFKIS